MLHNVGGWAVPATGSAGSAVSPSSVAAGGATYIKVDLHNRVVASQSDPQDTLDFLQARLEEAFAGGSVVPPTGTEEHEPWPSPTGWSLTGKVLAR